MKGYLKRFEEVRKKYAPPNIESTYWDLVMDSQAGELFDLSALLEVLIKSGQEEKNRLQVTECIQSSLSWFESVKTGKQAFDSSSDNLAGLFRIHTAFLIYSDLLQTAKPSSLQLFQSCISLALQLSSEILGSTREDKSTAPFHPIPLTRKNIKSAWMHLQQFLALYHLNIHQFGVQAYFSQFSPKSYFQLFLQTRDISFPTVFTQQHPNTQDLAGTIEACRIWLDIRTTPQVKKRKKTTLVPINNKTDGEAYEDRVIGETILKSVQEAVDCYRLRSGKENAKSIDIKTIFFNIGHPKENYDGASIGCATFFATLTRLTGRKIPSKLFYTGQINCNRNTIAGIIPKAVAGWEAGFNIFVLPHENLRELGAYLKSKQINCKMFSPGTVPSKTVDRAVVGYRNIEELYEIWESLTTTEHLSPKNSPIPEGISNLPNRNRHFTGRNKFFKFIRSRFSRGSSIASLSGMGGIGKTEICMEYAHRYAKQYSLIWKIRGESVSSIVIDYARLAKKLNLPQQDIKEEEVILNAIKEWLETHKNWLLIFDNVTNPSVLFNDELPILPNGANGHILISSRYHDWNEWCDQIGVETFTVEEATTFILNRSGQQNKGDAIQLAETLGYLPLALAQAAAYVKQQRIDISNYLHLFQTERKQLWEQENAPRNYENTIATTWNLSIAKLNKENPLAIDLLYLIAFYAPDDIPLVEIIYNYSVEEDSFSSDFSARFLNFSSQSKTLVKIRDTLKQTLLETRKDKIRSLLRQTQKAVDLNRAVEALKSYSLVDGTKELLSIHNLVQVVTQDQMGEKLKLQWNGIALQLANSLFPEKAERPEKWPLCARLFSHAKIIAEQSEQNRILPQTTLALLIKTGRYLYENAQYKKSSGVFEKALKILPRSKKKSQHQAYIDLYRMLGQNYEAVDQYTKAAEIYKKAHVKSKSSFGLNAPEVVTDLNNLGMISLKTGKLDDALAYFKNALNNIRQSHRKCYGLQSQCFNYLGQTCFAKGEFDGALVHYNQALNLSNSYFGRSHVNSTDILSHIATVYLHQGQLQKAEDDLLLALDATRDFLGKDHPKIADRLNQLGMIYLEKEEVSKSEDILQEAIEIDQKFFGEKHHAIARDHNSLGRLEKKKGNVHDALSHFKKSVQIARSIYQDAQHPFIANATNNYGYALLELQKFDQAFKYIKMALTINEKIYSKNHPIVALGRFNLGRLYHLQKNLEEAYTQYSNAYRIMLQLFGRNHSHLVEVKSRLIELAEDYNMDYKNRKENDTAGLFLHSPEANVIYKLLGMQK